MAKRKLPAGSRWRILAQDDSPAKVDLRTDIGPVFDELVIDDWLHLEQMSDNCWWMSLGDVRLWITVNKDGQASITVNDVDVKSEEKSTLYDDVALESALAEPQKPGLPKRIRLLKRLLEEAQAQFAALIIDDRPLTEAEKRYGQQLALEVARGQHR